MVKESIVRWGLLGSLTFTFACSTHAYVEPAQTTPSKVTTTTAPPMPGPDPKPAEPSYEPRPQPWRDNETQKLMAENVRLEHERDNARQWATEEQTRQEKDFRERQRRHEIEATFWNKLDDADGKLRLLRVGIENWTVKDRKHAIVLYQEAWEKRDRIEHDIRRVHVEPDHNFNQLRIDVEQNFEELSQMVQTALEAR